MTSYFVTSWLPKGIQVLDGDSLVGVVVNVAYSDSVETVADLSGTEVGAGRLAATAVATREEAGWTLNLDDLTTTSTAVDRLGVWWATTGATDADRLLIAYSDDPGGPESPYEPTWDDGLIFLPFESRTALRYDELADVDATGGHLPTNGDVPIWNASTGKWEPGDAGSGDASLPISSDDVDVPDAGDLTTVLTSVFATANAARDAIAADAWLQPVRAVATSNVNIGVGGLLTIDGVTVAAGDLVLLTGQTSPAESLVAMAAVGTWTTVAAAYVSGAMVRVSEGTLHAGSEWYISTPNPILSGTTAVTWTEFTGGGAALSDDDPADLGTADPGTSPDASRSDHVHDLPTAAAVGAVASSEKGAALGVADLDASGLIPSALLPSYVDDVLSYANLAAFPGTGATGKIYVAEDTNLTYRWSGSAYVEISASLALGTTSSTAHRGDQGAAAYTHSQVTSGNPHGVTKTDVSLGNVTNDAQVKLSTVTTKGDLYAATASGTVARLAAGTDGYRLVADSAQTTGLNWQAPATTPWQRRINLPGWSQPDTVSGTWTLATQTGASGVVATSATTNNQSWTWTDLPTGSGTWALDVIVRGVNNGGIITATIGGVSAGTFDCYAASTTVNTLLTATGIVLSSDARRDLVFTNTTKNGSSGNYQMNVQAIVLRRTGA